MTRGRTRPDVPLLLLACLATAAVPIAGCAQQSETAALSSTTPDSSEAGWWTINVVDSDGWSGPLDPARRPPGEPERVQLPADLLFFATDSAQIEAGGDKILAQVADLITTAANPAPVVLVGHTDSRGSDRYNQQLGLDRAAAARDFLVDLGVPPDRLAPVETFGETCPLTSNDNPTGQARNRRVEVLFNPTAHLCPAPADAQQTTATP
jgi:outer membrane protein OmpA-like peptidoglycan-associated protein